MIDLNPTRLRTLLELQDTLNQRVQPNWLQANNPWHRAAWIEAAELTESIGWKWWKQQTPDHDNVKIEIVDIFHFALSYVLQITQRDGVVDLDAAHGYIEQEQAWKHSMLSLTALEMIDRFVGECSFGRVSTKAIITLADHVGMTADDLYFGYVGKNLLNLFRQDHGYKQGTYIKAWREDGAEDNAFLRAIMKSQPDATPALLLGLMEAQYAKVLLHASMANQPVAV